MFFLLAASRPVPEVAGTEKKMSENFKGRKDFGELTKELKF